MTNEEILANAPGWATMVCMERFWQKLTDNSWRSIRLDLTYESLRIMPSANSGGIRSLSDIRRIVELEKYNLGLATESHELQQKLEAAERERERPPNEQGCNRYGLDMAYFRNVINRELNRPLSDYKPDELARVFARLSKTADKSVMFEPEFSSKFAIKQQIKAVEYCYKNIPDLADSDYVKLKRRAEELRQQLNGGE